MLKIAIVGGGFSGIAVLLHLVEKATQPFKVYLIEKSAKLCSGVAFGTESTCHPLNIRVNEMGAFSGKPEGFYEWLRSNKNERDRCSEFSLLDISKEEFLPRKLYALYLRDLLSQALLKAKEKKCDVEIIQDEVISGEKLPKGEIIICSKQKKNIYIDYLILALGVVPSKHFDFESQELLKDPRYTHSLWKTHSESIFGTLSLQNRKEDSSIIILGSGLTAVDALWSLKMMEFKGKILVISKSGQFPQSHLSDSFPSLLGERFIYPSRCSDLLKQFRKKWAEICMNGADWRQLISAYRPFSQEIWKQLSIASKKQFLRHLSHIWNRYRHRMSPESALLIQDFSTRQRLKLMSGSIKNIVKEENGKLRAFFLNTKVGSIESISADHIVNCSGPEYNLLKRSEGLISSLIENGLVLADSLGMGLKLEDKEFLAGNNEGKIFALGALLFGERFEITSVPEIRDQAAAIADIIISSQAEG